MPELADLKALPEIVQLWGSLWLFITGGIFWLTPKVLAVDDMLMKESENATTAGLWSINELLRRKINRTDLAGTDYLISVSDLRELQSAVRTSAIPLTKFAACRRYAEWVRLALAFHGAAWAIWVALILFTDLNETRVGVILFFGPLVGVLICGIKAALLRNEIHG